MDWITSLFSSISVGLSNVTAYLYALIAWLQAGLIYVWNTLVAAINWLWTVIQKIAAWFKALWQGGFKGLFGRLLKLYKDVHTWIEARLKPIIDFIKNAQGWWDRYYKLHILPMINLIQKIRRYLLILRLLHVKFATTLDNYLLRYEQALNKIFGTVHGALNQIIDWLNLATNPIGLGRLVLVSVATRRTVGALTRAITGLPLGHFFPYNGPGSFAFERKPMKVSDYTDPATNPPPSLILLPMLPFMQPAELDEQTVVSDVDIDASESLPWGGTFIKNYEEATLAMDALEYRGLSITQALQTQTGDLYDAGQATTNYIMDVLASYQQPGQ
jgi:hypothetical protein